MSPSFEPSVLQALRHTEPRSDTASTGPPVPAPRLARMLLQVPLALLRFYLRWVLRAQVGEHGGDLPARARRWARGERRLRPGRPGEVMAQLDYWTFTLVRRRAPARVLLSLLLLPVGTAASAWRVVAGFGPAARRSHGISLPAQLLEIWLLQLRFPVTFAHEPSLYYLNELYDPARRGEAPFIFAALHQNTLTRAVNGAGAGFMDKRAFAQRCAEARLAHIPTLGAIEPDGSTPGWHGAADLPREDLFTKPAGEGNGTGAARWIWQADGYYRSEAGALLDADAVLRELRSAARRGTLLVQRRLRNHPEIEALVGATLATVRFVTILHADGTVEPMFAIHRSAPRDAAVDNAAMGGIACPVALDTGMLGPAMQVSDAGVRFTDTHPRTGARVAGVPLPGWAETVTLVERAQRVFSSHPLVGWDVAITLEGPVLVEGNIIWVAKSLQAAHRMALGRLPYAERLLAQLERRVQRLP
jgi:hypothetical protein